MISKNNPVQGVRVEELLRNTLPKDCVAFEAAKKIAGIPSPAILNGSNVIGKGGRKVDVEFLFNGYSTPLTFSVKSFSAGYNHLERRNLEQFCARNQIRKNDKLLLQDMILAKAVGGRSWPLVPHDNRSRVEKIFSRIAVGSSALLGNDHPKALVLYSLNDRIFKIYDMNKQVIPHVNVSSVSFTRIGGNIEIGKYIVIQRKGSEGGKYSNSLTDIKHSANDVQIKMRVKKFYSEVAPACQYSI